GLIIISIVPATLWAGVLVGRARSRGPRRSARQAHREQRASIEALRSFDVTSEQGRREAYDQLSVLLRQHVRDARGVQADGLTPSEIETALSMRGDGAPGRSGLPSLLTACERARYGGPDTLGSADACRAAIEQAEQLIAALR